jgi:cell division initiation protein
MDLTPPEIQYQPIKRRGRGYDRRDVDRLLEEIAASYDRVWRERDDLRARVRELEGEEGSSRSSEHVLHEILVSAQRAADQVVEDAREEAERLLAAMREEAKTAAEHDLQGVRAEIDRLQSLERYIYSGLRARLEEGLKLIEDERPSEGAPAGEPLAEVTSAAAEDRHG